MKPKHALLLALALPALAPAQGFEASLNVGASAIRTKDIGSGFTLDSGFKLAGRMTMNTRDYTGYEIGYAYNRAQLAQAGQGEQGMGIHQGFAEVLLYATPRDARFRPFVAGGGHFANFVPPGASATQGQGETRFGINYGAGLKVKVTGPWQARLDFRQFNTAKPFGLGATGRMRINEISAGVSFTM
jgi:opacity protein-like surface antigen